MKTLFISDLDGTLLTSRGSISPESVRILRSLLNRGLAFTAATGRTPLSALPLLSELPVRLPLILLNGALTMTPDGKVTNAVPFSPQEQDLLCALEQESGLSGLQIGIRENRVFCSIPETQLWRDFFSENGIGRTILPRADFSDAGIRRLYSIYLDSRPDRLMQMVRALEPSGYFTLDFYKDRYMDALWGLEVYPVRVTKGAALQTLLRQEHFDACVCLIDGQNDLSLARCCTRTVAVANACPEVLAIADQITASHDEEGVARYLSSCFPE